MAKQEVVTSQDAGLHIYLETGDLCGPVFVWKARY
jgi:hypothetical protein